MVATKKIAQSRKVMKPLKATYKEILVNTLTHDTMIEEDKLLSTIVCKKYRVSRAKKTRKHSVYSRLKEGQITGEFRKAEINGKTYWRLGDGTIVEEGLKTSKVNEPSTLESAARKAASELEEFMLDLCKQRLEKAKDTIIPGRIEREIITRHRYEHADLTSGGKLDILKYASISDLGWVVTENWGYFSPPFENKGSFISKIKELNDYRRRIAHPNINPMDEEEMKFFCLAVRIFIRSAL